MNCLLPKTIQKVLNMKNNSNIIVPIDFTDVTEQALEYACVLIKNKYEEINLIHIINDESEENQNIIKQKLDGLALHYSNKHQLKINPNFRLGNIFTGIAAFCNEKKAEYIVMGTHGVKGLQHIVGAFAVKVILSSKVPVIITQKNTSLPKKEAKIVVPINESEELTQMLLKLVDISKSTNSTVVLYKKHSENELDQDKINLNVRFFEKHLAAHLIPFEVMSMAHEQKDFHKEFIKLAEKISANLIVILTTTEKGIKDLVLGPVEQQIINNPAKVPVMCINTLQTIYSE